MVLKYIKLGLMALKEEFEFKAEIISDFILSLVSAFLFIYFWALAGYKDSKSYFLIVQLLGSFSYCSVLIAVINRKIRDGILTTDLYLPLRLDLNFYFKILFISFTDLLHSLAYLIIFLFLIQIKSTIILVFLYQFLSFTLTFYFLYLISILLFYTESGWGIHWMTNIIVSLFSGKYIPIDILTKDYPILKYLPFKYMRGVLWDIYNINNLWENTILTLFWIVVFYFLSRLAWKIHLKRYQAYGI